MSDTITTLVYLTVFAIAGACFWRVVDIAIQELKNSGESAGTALALSKALVLLIVALIAIVCAVAGFEVSGVFEASKLATS